MGDQGDKTEEPTPHKLREARKKGQVVKSKEITTALLFFASYYTLSAFLPRMWSRVSDFFKACFSIIGENLEMGTIGMLTKEALFTMLMTLAPLLAINFFLAIFSESLQSGFNFAVEPLKPKLNKINPIEGFKRIFSLKGLVELAKSIAKMGIIFFIMHRTILPALPMLLQTMDMPIMGALAMVGKLAFDVAIRVGLFYIAVAVFDYFWQRKIFMKQMKMSKQEVKDEYKKLEGDPMVKQRQRDMALSLAGGRKSGGAAGADAVVTNPTHIAVAIKYDPEIMQAPQVVAKGKMLVAEEIKTIAEENQVYITENKELAWAIFNSAEVGDEIPPDLYTGVAEILAFVYEIRKKRASRKKVA